MPNIFSRRKNRLEEPYIRPNLLQLPRTDSIESDATAPNLPGPGRNMGLLFDTVGGKLERLLNSMAGRFRLGPQAIVEDIFGLRQYRKDRWGGNLSPVAPTDEEFVVLRKQCRKLLKYCRSHLLGTQLEAFNAMITLAIEDTYLRQILADVSYYSYLSPRYNERQLHVASSKAFISIKENEVYDFYFRFRTGFSWRGVVNDMSGSKRRALRDQLESILSDSNLSFLFARLLCRDPSPMQSAYTIYTHVAMTKPSIIEWESLREIFAKHSRDTTPHTYELSVADILRLANHFPVLNLYQTRSTFGQDLHRQEAESLDIEEVAGNSDSIIWFLNHLCGSRDLITQLQYLRNLNGKTRRLFQKTVFGNEILIACAHARWKSTRPWIPWIVHQEFESEAMVMLEYYLRGNADERSMAKSAIAMSMEFSRYFKRSLANLVSRCNDLIDMPSILSMTFTTLSFHPLLDSPFYRGDFFHNTNIRLAGEDSDMHEDDILVDLGLYELIEVHGDEEPFDITGHFPILAGFDVSGDELYFAMFDDGEFFFTYIPDKARNVSIADSNGKTRVLSHFYVLVLNHDPSDFGVDSIPDGAKFQTGPAYWIRGGKRDLKDGANVSNFAWDWREGARAERRIEEMSDVDDWDSELSVDDWKVRYADVRKSNSEKIEVPTDRWYEWSVTGMHTEQDNMLASLENEEDGMGRLNPLTDLRRARQLVEEDRRLLEAEKQALAERERSIRRRELELEEHQSKKAVRLFDESSAMRQDIRKRICR